MSDERNIDQIKVDATFEADVIVFNTLRKQFKELGIAMKRNTEVHINSDFYEGRDVEHVTIDKIPMYYKRISANSKGSGIKFHLDMIQVKMPELYEHLYSLFKQTSGPEFMTAVSLEKWLEKNALHIHLNKKLKAYSKIGVFENTKLFDNSTFADIESQIIDDVKEKHQTYFATKMKEHVVQYLTENDVTFELLNMKVANDTWVDCNVGGVPIIMMFRLTGDSYAMYNVKRIERTLPLLAQTDDIVKYPDTMYSSLKKLVTFVKSVQGLVTDNIKAVSKSGVFEKIKSFNDFNK